MTGPIRDLMTAHGDGGKKIWITEFGAPTNPGGVTEATQAEILRQGAEKARHALGRPAALVQLSRSRDRPGGQRGLVRPRPACARSEACLSDLPEAGKGAPLSRTVVVPPGRQIHRGRPGASFAVQYGIDGV